jgi:hypothetical protein
MVGEMALMREAHGQGHLAERKSFANEETFGAFTRRWITY